MLDIIIKSGIVIDGTGAEGFVADIGIKNGKIIKIGNIDENADKVIDAGGLTVTPGFIDSHSHSDNALFRAPEMREKCEQGITTSIGGQCGSSLLANKNDKLAEPKNLKEITKDLALGSNLATFVGH